jgi:hypothetical protein
LKTKAMIVDYQKEHGLRQFSLAQSAAVPFEQRASSALEMSPRKSNGLRILMPGMPSQVRLPIPTNVRPVSMSTRHNISAPTLTRAPSTVAPASVPESSNAPVPAAVQSSSWRPGELPPGRKRKS